MTFRELPEGELIICDGEVVEKIRPTIKNGKYINAKDCMGEFLYLEDNGVHIFESID